MRNQTVLRKHLFKDITVWYQSLIYIAHRFAQFGKDPGSKLEVGYEP